MIKHGTRAGYVAAITMALLVAQSAATVAFSTPGRVEAAGPPTLEQYKAWMADARKTYPYPQSLDKMYRVMLCESGGNARASGGRGAWLGLFQYTSSTWRGRWNPYRNSSIWDAKAQIYATAKAWSIGMQRHWSCYYHTSGR